MLSLAYIKYLIPPYLPTTTMIIELYFASSAISLSNPMLAVAAYFELYQLTDIYLIRVLMIASISATRPD